MVDLEILRVLRARRTIKQRVAEVVQSLPAPPADKKYVVVRANPLRMLLIGSGAAVGYGVSTRAEALDGQLADLLADGLDRGVISNNYARVDTRLSQQVARATAELGFGTAQLIVWCPSHLELTEKLWGTTWDRNLTELLRVGQDASIVVVELSTPTGGDWAARGAATLINRINQGLRTAVARYPNAAIVASPPLSVEGAGVPTIGPDYYRQLGATTAHAALELLRQKHRSHLSDLVVSEKGTRRWTLKGCLPTQRLRHDRTSVNGDS